MSVGTSGSGSRPRSAREVKGCLDVAGAHGYVETVDARLLDTLAHVTATLVRLVNGRR